MHAFITGASRGIGFAIAQKLLNEGFTITGTSRSEDSPFDHANYSHIKCDLVKDDDLQELKPLFSEDEIPEVLINNAGMFEEVDFGAPDEQWLSNWDRTMKVNVRSSALIAKWAINSWNDKEIDGRIINISSRAAYRGDTQEYASYAASKAGMAAFTKSIARSFGEDGITAYTIAPGFVDTDMARGSIDVYGEEYLTKGLALDSIAPPEEIAEIVLLLAKGRLRHATGQTFHINSGSYLV